MILVTEIMNADQIGEKMILFADELGKDLAGKGRQSVKELKRAQIRNIFAEARKIESEWGMSETDAMRHLNMLKPKLAYQAKRHGEVEPLRQVLVVAIDEVGKAATDKEREKKFQRFMDLFESILAYHRFYGGN